MGQTSQPSRLTVMGAGKQIRVSHRTVSWREGRGTLLPQHRLMNIKETSLFIGLEVDTIYRMVSHRRIPFVKVGSRTMFDVQLLKAWLAEHTVLPLPRKVA